MSIEPAESDKVGYGKPPKQHRFQKGCSGNRNGRPKKKQKADFRALLKEALDETVIANEHRRRKAVTKLNAIAKELVNKAVSGDNRSIKLLVDLLNQFPEAKDGPLVIYRDIGDDML